MRSWKQSPEKESGDENGGLRLVFLLRKKTNPFHHEKVPNPGTDMFRGDKGITC
jgi:hypothetical protein